MELLSTLIIFFIFYLGAIFGSFLNVLAHEIEPNVFEQKPKKTLWQRLNRRSRCIKCQYQLKSEDLFPVFSWLALRAKCRKCQTKISSKYFFVEIFSGFLLLAIFWKVFNPSIENLQILKSGLLSEFIFFIPIFFALVIIFLFDFKHKIIPSIIIHPAILYVLFYSYFFYSKNLEFFTQTLLYSFLSALPFFLLWAISKGRAMGFADWKLIFLLALLLEENGQRVLFVIGAFWVGALYFMLTLPFKGLSLKSEVPFGPFIIVSFVITFTTSITYLQFLNIFV